MNADYIIIGAGSAGCAMAYRLSEDGKNKVQVVEYGGTDWGPFIQMPGALSYPMNMARYDWGYQSEPEPFLGGRRLAAPRGKVVGGSSSINGMVYVRGHARDYDTWAELGAQGWSGADVMPYFKRQENWDASGHGGDADVRGDAGPLHVQRACIAAHICITAVARCIPVFLPLEVRHHIRARPALRAQFGPSVIVPRMAAHIDHAVDRRRPANHFAPWGCQPAPAQERFWFGLIAPVIARHVHRIAKCAGHLDKRPPIGAAIFHNLHFVFAVFGQAIGHCTASRASADDDVIRVHNDGFLVRTYCAARRKKPSHGPETGGVW